jgi:hypothetical protein
MPAYNAASFDSTLVTASAAAIGTVTSGKVWRITSIILTNYTDSTTPASGWVQLYIGGTTDTYKIKGRQSVQPGGSVIFSEPLLLPSGTVIYAAADAISKFTAFVNRVEMHTP